MGILNKIKNVARLVKRSPALYKRYDPFYYDFEDEFGLDLNLYTRDGLGLDIVEFLKDIGYYDISDDTENPNDFVKRVYGENALDVLTLVLRAR